MNPKKNLRAVPKITNSDFFFASFAALREIIFYKNQFLELPLITTFIKNNQTQLLRLRPIIYFLLLFYSFRIYAQQPSYVFQHLTSKDGLATDKVNGIFQDSKGFYWIGTINGLQKFDGKTFTSIPFVKEGKTESVLTITNSPLMLEDKEGNIWVAGGIVIYIYHPLTGKYESIKIKDDTNAIASDIRYFCKDEWGDIWITTELNLYKYNYQSHKAIFWSAIFKKTEKRNWPMIIYDHTKKGLWIVGSNDILLVDIKSRNISNPFSNQTPVCDTAYGQHVGFFMDSKQNFWFGVWDGFIFKYNTLTFQKNIHSVYPENNKSKNQKMPIASCFMEDNNGRIWIGTLDKGLFYYDEQNDTILPVTTDNKLPYSLHYESAIIDLSQDNEGNIFACTDKGISVFNPSFQQFFTLDENNLINPFPKVSVTRIFETSSKNILVSTSGKGWFIYDRNFQLKKQFYDSNPPTYWREYRRNLAWCFAEDISGKIWIGYQYGLIGIFDTVTYQIKYIDVPEFERKTIRTMESDAEHNIWFGLHSGSLGKWDEKKKKFFVYKNSLQSSREVGAAISAMSINKSGEIWCVTNGDGFYRFDPVKEKIAEKYIQKNQDSTIENLICIRQINDSIIGIGSQSLGVLLFNERRKTFTSITKDKGLPVNEIYDLAKDNGNNLWIATIHGMVRMKNKKLVLFDEQDGIINERFDYNLISLHDGRMAVPTASGIMYFYPDKIKEATEPPDVRITNFKIGDQSLLIDSLLAYKTLDLNHEQNFISISYASLSFLERNTTQYYYKLDDVDRNWISAGTQRIASYTNLSSGHYTFKVKCKNREGKDSKHITELNIYIHPAWWFSWWAYSFYILFIAGLIYSWYRNRINSLEKKQSDKIKAMVATQEEERKRISRDLHDDMGTKLTALKLFLSSLNEKAGETNNDEIKSLANISEQYIKEAMQDIRQLLLNLSPTVLEEFGYTTAVEGIVNKINETKQINFSLVMFGMEQRLEKVYELALYRITQELINNVLKHAEAKNVSLQIGQRDEKIILMMEDDGKGFDLNTHKDGYGLHNLDSRTKLMQGTMTIDSKYGKGTSVLIEIPYKRN